MSLTPQQYIALSALVYESTSKNDIKAPIGNIISRVENRNKLEYAAQIYWLDKAMRIVEVANPI